MKLKDFVDKGYYINLDYKVDRNQKTIEELKKYDLLDLVERVSAVQAFNETIKCQYGSDDWKKCVDGCSQSHLKIIKNSIDNGHKRILIFEDDIHFYEDGVTPCMDKIESALDELSNISEWDILYLGGSLLDNEITMMNKHLIKVQGMNTSHAYIINHTAFDKILNTYHYAYPMDILLSVSLNPKFSVYPVAVTQRGGDVSDIGGHDSFGPSGFINSYLKPIKNINDFLNP
jgi:GR25 family glycosyltransferase involved in LPS biosynthesis